MTLRLFSAGFLIIFVTIFCSRAQGRVILIGSNHADIHAEYKFKRALCQLANEDKIIFATEAISINDKTGILKNDFGCDRNAFGIEEELSLATMATLVAFTHVKLLFYSQRTNG